MSVSSRANVEMIQVRRSPIPSAICALISSNWLANWAPTRYSVADTTRISPKTVRPAATSGGRTRARRRWIGMSSAARSRAMTMGMTICLSRMTTQSRTRAPAVRMSRRQVHSLATFRPRGTRRTPSSDGSTGSGSWTGTRGIRTGSRLAWLAVCQAPRARRRSVEAPMRVPLRSACDATCLSSPVRGRRGRQWPLHGASTGTADCLAYSTVGWPAQFRSGCGTGRPGCSPPRSAR